ncbi:hypothetical protein J6590_024867 [Homalodisca vitripennis]|nr:hypothetical protein J6590_024867 [Homalodisca vitripennis]
MQRSTEETLKKEMAQITNRHMGGLPLTSTKSIATVISRFIAQTNGRTSTCFKKKMPDLNNLESPENPPPLALAATGLRSINSVPDPRSTTPSPGPGFYCRAGSENPSPTAPTHLRNPRPQLSARFLSD